MFDQSLERDRGAKRMAHEMSLLGADLVEESHDRTGQIVEIAIDRGLGRLAVTRQVDRIDGTVLGELLDIEQPIVGIAAKSMNEDDRNRLALGSRRLEDSGLAAALDLALGDRAGAVIGQRRDHEARDKSVDVGVGNRRRRHDRDQSADRQNVARIRHEPANNSRGGAFKHIGDLGSLDLRDFLAFFDLGAILDEPPGQGALLHRQAPFRHDDRLNFAHLARPPITARTASRIFAGLGI